MWDLLCAPGTAASKADLVSVLLGLRPQEIPWQGRSMSINKYFKTETTARWKEIQLCEIMSFYMFCLSVPFLSPLLKYRLRYSTCCCLIESVL